MKLIKIIYYFFLTIIVLIILGVSYLYFYIIDHKHEILTEVSHWYSDHFYGQLHVGDVDVSIYKTFPKIAIVLKDIKITDTLIESNVDESLKLKELDLGFSFKALVLDKKLEIEDVRLLSPEIYIYNDSIGSHKFLNPKKPLKMSSGKGDSEVKLDLTKCQVHIRDFKFTHNDSIDTAYATFRVNYFKATFHGDPKTKLTLNCHIDAYLDKVGFNLENGTFFNGLHLVGSFVPVINMKTMDILMNDMTLDIDNQPYYFDIDLRPKTNFFVIKIFQPYAIYKKVVPYLSQNIQQVLDELDFDKTIDARCKITGRFENSSNPLVQLHYRLDGNNMTIQDSIHIDDIHAEGTFVNRFYNLDNVDIEESHSNLLIIVPNLRASIKDIPFTLTNSSYTDNDDVEDYIKTHLNIENSPFIFNTLFNNQDFIFSEKGHLSINTDIDGSIDTIPQIIDNFKGSFLMDNTSVYYKPLNINLPIDTLQATFQHNDAILNNFVIPLENKPNKIRISGQIINAPSLISGENEKVHSIVNIKTNSLVWEDFTALFKEISESETYKKSQTEKKQTNREKSSQLSKSLSQLYHDFHPEMSVSVDKFMYQHFVIEDARANIIFNSNKDISIANTGFEYHKSPVNLNLDFDFSNPDYTIFNTTFNLRDLDIVHFLKDFDYFGIPSFKEAKRISGTSDVSMEATAKIDVDSGLLYKSIEGTATFDLKDFELNDFEPIIQIGSKLFKKKRFEDIKFAPISNTITVNDGVIYVPQLEIRSTAFDMYLEGHYGFEKNTNFWITVPIENILKRNLETPPELKGADFPSDNFYVEVDDSGGETVYKLRLSKKKFFEEKGAPEEFKAYKKMRRERRKEIRKMKREQRKMQK